MFDVPHGRTWWSVDNAIRVMNDNEIRVAILSPVGLPPMSTALLKPMMAVRDGSIGRIKPIRELIRKATRQENQKMAELAASHPDRFGFFATLMLRDAEDALRARGRLPVEHGAYGNESGVQGHHQTISGHKIHPHACGRIHTVRELDPQLQRAINCGNAEALFPRLRPFVATDTI